jgi:cell division protein FtsB
VPEASGTDPDHEEVVNRRERIIKLKAQLEVLEKERKILELRTNALKDELTNIVLEGFKNGEKLLDLISTVK